jgi:hypothetical protein
MSYRAGFLAVCVALGATTPLFAQSTPPANSTMSPANSATATPNDGMSNDSSVNPTAPSNSDKVGQDPKMKSCLTSEKAKNSGLSDDQVKQKCMMQIASHQGPSNK